MGVLCFKSISAAGPSPEQVMIIPHTHWDGAFSGTRQEYLDSYLPNIVKVLDLLKRDPDYRFTLDQMCYVRPFLERYPSDVADFKRFLAEGRLQIVGGTDVMNDTNVPSGESIARQYLIAKSYFRERLGYEVTTGWAIDTFGHNAQLPQILKLAGMKSYWFMRGVPTRETPSEFLWQGLDGTQVPAFWLPFTYTLAYDMPTTELEFGAALRRRFDVLTPFSRGPERVMLAGADLTEPDESLPSRVQHFNTSPQPFSAKLAVPAEFEALVEKRPHRAVVGGELNPVYQGAYSSRIEMKQATRESERVLTTAEKFDVLASIAGHESNPNALDDAWEPVLFNQEHDPSAGTVIDAVYDDSMRGYQRAQEIGQEAIRRSTSALLQDVDTSGEGTPIAIFNTLSWPRTDIAEVEITLRDRGAHGLRLLDNSGRPVPIQFLDIDPINAEFRGLTLKRYGDGSIRAARIAFIARDVPALGYAIYHVVPDVHPPTVPTVRSVMQEDHATLENEFYRASFDLWTGGMTDLSLKQDHWQALANPGNVVAREYDGGDLWQLYGQLTGVRSVAMKTAISPPRAAYTQWSSDFVGGNGRAIVGPVFSEFQIAHALGENAFSSRVRLYAGLRRIDCRTELTNKERFVRYRALFPTTIKAGTAVHEIPFGALERPVDQEFPAQNWIDYSDKKHGLTLINRGIPGNNVSSHGQLMLSLARSAHIGVYDPNTPFGSSDSGLELGKTLSLEYALAPHVGDWRAQKPWRAGLEFNNPLITQTTPAHAGSLPKAWGLLEISDDAVVVSALKPGKDGTVILRLYEAAGKPARTIDVDFHNPISQVHETNILEDRIADISSSGGRFSFDMKPFEIKTFQVTIDRVK